MDVARQQSFSQSDVVLRVAIAPRVWRIQHVACVSMLPEWILTRPADAVAVVWPVWCVPKSGLAVNPACVCCGLGLPTGRPGMLPWCITDDCMIEFQPQVCSHFLWCVCSCMLASRPAWAIHPGRRSRGGNVQHRVLTAMSFEDQVQGMSLQARLWVAHIPGGHIPGGHIPGWPFLGGCAC